MWLSPPAYNIIYKLYVALALAVKLSLLNLLGFILLAQPFTIIRNLVSLLNIQAFAIPGSTFHIHKKIGFFVKTLGFAQPLIIVCGSCHRLLTRTFKHLCGSCQRLLTVPINSCHQLLMGHINFLWLSPPAFNGAYKLSMALATSFYLSI